MDFNTWLKQYPVVLNPQQKEAVQTVQGPVLLLAVPGSGKTTVLVMRLGWMVQGCSIPPSSIVTITYTVSAVKDMQARFASLFGIETAEKMVFRTINGISARIIYQYGRIIGKPPYQLISDDKTVLQTLSSIYQSIMHEYPNESDLKDIRTKITYIKNMMLSQEEINRLNQDVPYNLAGIYQAYQTWLKKQKMIDYDDQMVYALRILQTDRNMLKRVQDQFGYICVDEAQDTSRIQHEIIRLLASRNANLFMVGDEDQSIYGFRAAWPQALLDFSMHYPKSKVLLMEENYRSSPQIVNLADRFVSRNTQRHEKHMHTRRQNGENVEFIELSSRSGQIRYIINEVQKSSMQTAVLFRNNENAIPLIDQLERNGIPYTMNNVDSVFFSHRTVNDICMIMQFLLNPYDTDTFVKIYFKLNLYLKKEEAVKVAQTAKNQGKDIFTAADHIKLQDYVRQGLFQLKQASLQINSKYARQILHMICDTLGYRSYLQRSCISEDKLYILEQIARHVTNIRSFLNRLNELAELIRNGKSGNQGNLILSTIHSAKGLEYDRVILLDTVTGVLPSITIDHIDHIDHKDKEAMALYQEERRLFYVALTRAKERLTLFAIAHSPFVGEIRPPVMKKKDSKPGADYTAYAKKMKKGSKVIHDEYGEGVIRKKENDRITVAFKDMTKTFSLKILYREKVLHHK